MRIILDTSAFYFPVALELLSRQPEDIVVPAVAFTERARQLARDGRMSPAELLDELARNEIAVESYGEEEAMRFATGVRDDARWKKLARDAMIAGHVREGDVLWTANPLDFAAVGLAPAQIRDPTRASGGARHAGRERGGR